MVKLRVCGIDFADPGDPVVRRAARYDTVIVVGEEYMLVDRVDAYTVFGVEARLYPLPAVEAPTLVSILGLLGWIWERLGAGKRVLVEGTGGEAVVASACMVVEGYSVEEALAKLREAGMELYSPLQLRLLVILEALSSAINIREEAERFKAYAFSGGDAHLASIVELAVEHYVQIGRLLPISLQKLYAALVNPVRGPRLNDAEKALAGIAQGLDSTLIGAVRSVHLEVGESSLKVRIGCSLLMREGECWPEAMAADQHYRRLASMLGLKTVEYEMIDPEEAACLAYGQRGPELCT